MPRTPHSVCFAFVLSCFLLPPLGAQQKLPALPTPAAFEVASIRLTSPEVCSFSLNNSGSSRFTAHCISLKMLIALAYEFDMRWLAPPAWTDQQIFSIDAKAEGDAPLTPHEFAPLLRQLLVDRFHLIAHRKSSVVPGYALTIAKHGPKLSPGVESAEHTYISLGRFQSPSASIASLVSFLSSQSYKPIVDKTGLTGNYKFDLEYAPLGDYESSKPLLFKALEEKYGLKLVPDPQVPLEMLIVDHVDRIPTEN